MVGAELARRRPSQSDTLIGVFVIKGSGGRCYRSTLKINNRKVVNMVKISFVLNLSLL